jgi:hypothetical protein
MKTNELRILAFLSADDELNLSEPYVVLDCNRGYVAWLERARAALPDDPAFFATEYLVGLTMVIDAVGQVEELQKRLSELRGGADRFLLTDYGVDLIEADVLFAPASVFLTRRGVYWEMFQKHGDAVMRSAEVPWEAIEAWRSSYDSADKDKEIETTG